jgi:RimJ/RimL family protein N-acetyltransferase
MSTVCAPCDIVVAPMSLQYIESFHRALGAVARERKYLTLLQAPPLPETREFVLKGMDNGDPQFVALAGAEVVGWCDVRRHYFPAHAHRGTLGMGIVPDYRGRGLGRRLLERTLEVADELGFVRVEFGVHADNARALALYGKMGFVREGVLRDAVFVDGEFRDAIMMARVRRANAARGA